MPVEIRELQITTVVDPGSHPASPNYSTDDPPEKKDDIVALVVEQVMQILNEKKER
jgi:hypothetical protein